MGPSVDISALLRADYTHGHQWTGAQIYQDCSASNHYLMLRYYISSHTVRFRCQTANTSIMLWMKQKLWTLRYNIAISANSHNVKSVYSYVPKCYSSRISNGSKGSFTYARSICDFFSKSCIYSLDIYPKYLGNTVPCWWVFYVSVLLNHQHRLRYMQYHWSACLIAFIFKHWTEQYDVMELDQHWPR